jgi:hydrogenase maturation protein HypF
MSTEDDEKQADEDTLPETAPARVRRRAEEHVRARHGAGQAAVELEAVCDLGERRGYPMPLLDDGGPLVMDARPLLRGLVDDLEGGVEVGTIAARFHNGLATTTARACALASERGRTDTVVLSGGVFQNRRPLGETASLLADSGLRVLTPSLLPPKDGGIAYGQLAVAAATLAAEEGSAGA